MYEVVRDTREQRGWSFPASDSCVGTCVRTLETGDYTLIGYESKFVIERKRSIGELSQNLFEPRFERELERMDTFELAYLILEFDMAQIISFPVGSGIPEHRWQYSRLSPQVLLKRFHEIQIAHPTIHVILAGKEGRNVASSLFKRVIEHYATK